MQIQTISAVDVFVNKTCNHKDFMLNLMLLFAYSKDNNYIFFIRKRKNIGHVETEQNNRKVKLKRKGCIRENSKYKRILSVKIITGPWQNGQCQKKKAKRNGNLNGF